MVRLKTKNGKHRIFSRESAIRLLSMNNAQWEIDDKNLKWNGNDIIKRTSKTADSKTKEQ